MKTLSHSAFFSDCRLSISSFSISSIIAIDNTSSTPHSLHLLIIFFFAVSVALCVYDKGSIWCYYAYITYTHCDMDGHFFVFCVVSCVYVCLSTSHTDRYLFDYTHRVSDWMDGMNECVWQKNGERKERNRRKNKDSHIHNPPFCHTHFQLLLNEKNSYSAFDGRKKVAHIFIYIQKHSNIHSAIWIAHE